MKCIGCKEFRILNNESKETYGFCSKKQTETYPFDVCNANKKILNEKRAIKIYMDNYQTKSLDEIVKMINLKDIDKYKLNYLITKHFLPRKDARRL